MKAKSLRRQKLRWCAEHNLAMQQFREMPVKYLLSHMPEYLRLFHQDYARALDNLNQYLTSARQDYWQSRDHYIRELCAALQLSMDTWCCDNFCDFVAAATVEYQAQCLYTAETTPQSRLAVDQLRQLPAIDGKDVISFEVDRHSSVLHFRRSARHPVQQRFHSDDRVRIRFHPGTPGFGLLFLLDPTDRCQVIAPTLYQADTSLRGGVLDIPDHREPKFHMPEKTGSYSLYAIAAAEPVKNELCHTDGEARLSEAEMKCLLAICSSLIQQGSRLYRSDFSMSLPAPPEEAE